MAEAPRDGNYVPALLGTSLLDSRTPVAIWADPATHELLVKASVSITPSGTQDVNLTKIGGVAVALGQTTMSASFPVTIASNQSALPVVITAGSTDYYPMYNRRDFGGTTPATDPSGALVIRGAITTDEGAQRANFTGTSISTSPGTATFVNGSSAVTGSGFASADLNFLDYVKLNADGESAWAQVAFVNSDTSLTLFSNYTGTGGTGTYNVSPVATITGSGATISVASGQLTIASGNTAATNTVVFSTNSSPPLVFETSISISQRIVNQDIYVGIESATTTPFRAFARFHFTSTNNTQVITESAYNPTTNPSAAETESNTITLPAGAVTSGTNVYKINMNLNQVVFSINGVVVATHIKKMPHKNVNVYYGNLRFANGTTPATSTNIISDYVLFYCYDRIDTWQPLVSNNTGPVDSMTQRIVQGNNAGKTIQSAGGSASSNGNNTLVAAGTNRLKVKAYVLTTTSTTAMTCIFQSGAGGTELWRVLLQGPGSVTVGANLSVPAPDFLFATATATLLNLNLSSANTVMWSVSYYDEV